MGTSRTYTAHGAKRKSPWSRLKWIGADESPVQCTTTDRASAIRTFD